MLLHHHDDVNASRRHRSLRGPGPTRIDLRLLDAPEEHLESEAVLGVDIGDGHGIPGFLARLEMEHVEALLPLTFSTKERATVLCLVVHRKGRLPAHELPGSEARERAVELERVERTGRNG